MSADEFCSVIFLDAEKRLCDIQMAIDKRCCAYQHRKVATEKATAHLETMVKRILTAGVSATKYLLIESWFKMPATVVALARNIKIIGMAKKSSRIHYLKLAKEI